MPFPWIAMAARRWQIFAAAEDPKLVNVWGLIDHGHIGANPGIQECR